MKRETSSSHVLQGVRTIQKQDNIPEPDKPFFEKGDLVFVRLMPVWSMPDSPCQNCCCGSEGIFEGVDGNLPGDNWICRLESRDQANLSVGFVWKFKRSSE